MRTFFSEVDLIKFGQVECELEKQKKYGPYKTLILNANQLKPPTDKQAVLEIGWHRKSWRDIPENK